MFRRFSYILPVFCLAFLAMPSFVSAEAVDIDTLMVVKTIKEAPVEAVTTTDQSDIKDIIKTPNEWQVKEMTDKEKEAEKQKLTKNLNYLLIEAYKGKVDRIFGNLAENIKRYPPEVQLRILQQVGDSVGAKIEVIDEKWNAISTNRKEILIQVLTYIHSLVQEKIAKVNGEK